VIYTGFINDLRAQSCSSEIGFSVLDCPQSLSLSLSLFFLIIRRMAFLTCFLQTSIVLLIQLSKECAKAALVSNLATQTHACDSTEQPQ